MKATKRFLSAIMAMTMVCGTAVTVSAEGGEVTENAIAVTGTAAQTQAVTGVGSTEGWVETNIMRVVLPTDSLAFTVDAQGLVKQNYATDAKGAHNYKDCTIVYSDYDAPKVITDAKVKNITEPESKVNKVLEDGFVFFTSTDTKGKKTISNHIDLVLVNKGTYDVKITPTLSYEGGENGFEKAKCAINETMDDSKGLGFNLYVKGVGEDKKTTYKYYTDDTAVQTVNNVKDYYKVDYTASTTEGGAGTYNYTLDADAYKKAEAKLDNKLTYTLVGYSNPDLVKSNSKAGNISIVWKVEKPTT